MFAVVEFSDGRYEEVDVISEYGDYIEFRTLDGSRYEFRPNLRGLFNECRGEWEDSIFTEKIRRVMVPTNEEGEKELRGYLKKGEKEMTKHEMTKQFLAAQEAVEKAKKALEKATENLTKVEKLIEEQANQKPKVVFKSRGTYDIVKYHKYSDNYIEFETSLQRYRYIRLSNSDNITFPLKKMTTSLTYDLGHVFEVLDAGGYRRTNLIDHIELLEGVNEYDS